MVLHKYLPLFFLAIIFSSAFAITPGGTLGVVATAAEPIAAVGSNPVASVEPTPTKGGALIENIQIKVEKCSFGGLSLVCPSQIYELAQILEIPSNLGSLTQSNSINVYVVKGSTKIKVIKFSMPNILNDKSSFTVWDYWSNKDMQFKFNYGAGFTPSISYEQFDITWDSIGAGFKQIIVNEIRFLDVALLEKVLVDEAAKKAAAAINAAQAGTVKGEGSACSNDAECDSSKSLVCIGDHSTKSVSGVQAGYIAGKCGKKLADAEKCWVGNDCSSGFCIGSVFTKYDKTKKEYSEPVFGNCGKKLAEGEGCFLNSDCSSNKCSNNYADSGDIVAGKCLAASSAGGTAGAAGGEEPSGGGSTAAAAGASGALPTIEPVKCEFPSGQPESYTVIAVAATNGEQFEGAETVGLILKAGQEGKVGDTYLEQKFGGSHDHRMYSAKNAENYRKKTDKKTGEYILNIMKEEGVALNNINGYDVFYNKPEYYLGAIAWIETSFSQTKGGDGMNSCGLMQVSIKYHCPDKGGSCSGCKCGNTSCWAQWDDSRVNIKAAIAGNVSGCIKKGLDGKYKGNCTAKHMQALVKGLEKQCISVAEVAAAAGHNWGCGGGISKCEVDESTKTIKLIMSDAYSNPGKAGYPWRVISAKILLQGGADVFPNPEPGPQPVPVPSAKCQQCSSVLQCLACVDEKAYDYLFYLEKTNTSAVINPASTAGSTATVNGITNWLDAYYKDCKTGTKTSTMTEACKKISDWISEWQASHGEPNSAESSAGMFSYLGSKIKEYYNSCSDKLSGLCSVFSTWYDYTKDYFNDVGDQYQYAWKKLKSIASSQADEVSEEYPYAWRKVKQGASDFSNWVSDLFS